MKSHNSSIKTLDNNPTITMITFQVVWKTSTEKTWNYQSGLNRKKKTRHWNTLTTRNIVYIQKLHLGTK